MIKVGITGGIGSGKSIVASLFNLYDIPVYIADIESKWLTETSPIIKDKLTTLFGNNLYTDKGLNKKLLASYIFNNPKYLQQVNAIIHPEVNKHFLAWTQMQTGNICAIESAILFESGFNHIVDKCLMVYAPLDIRIARATARDYVSKEEVVRRIENQLSDEIKKEQADYTIYNDDNQALLPQVKNFLASLEETV